MQLLEAIPNIEKNNTDFDVWLKNTIASDAVDDYKKKHYIPKSIDLTFVNFLEFVEKREELFINQLSKELL